MTIAIEARGLGKQYGRRWALTDCTLTDSSRARRRPGRPQRGRQDHPAEPGHRHAGAHDGHDRGPRRRPASSPEQLARVGYVAQDTPTYAGLSVADHLRFGAHMNPGWDAALAQSRIEQLGLDPAQKAGKLSGGQRAQLALTLAIAKRPELLILDEPIASLDPLARREFLQILMEATAEQELSVVMSSHLVADLERVADYLIVLVGSRVQVDGETETCWRATGC